MVSFPEDRRVVALDLLAAQPQSEESNFDVSFDGLADLVAEFAAAIGLTDYVLLGHSHGGALALRLATMRPDLLNALVLLCPAHPFSGYSESVVRFYLSPVGARFARLAPRLPRRVQRFGMERMTGPGKRLSRAQVDRYRSVLLRNGAIARVLRLLSSWQSDMRNLREALLGTPICLPALLIWGDRDSVVPLASAPNLVAHLTEWELCTIAGAGHLLADEVPANCGALIRTWLISRDSREDDQRG